MIPSRLDVDRVLAETFIARAEYHATLPSTNDRAMACALEGPGELPLLIAAERQTAGRGRGGHRWWTGPGSLAFSLLLGPGQLAVTEHRQSPLIALAAALAVVDVLAPRIPSQTVGIRWPNDVVATDGKLAGILVDVLPDRRHILGIGVNTNNSLDEAPPELRRTATTLLEITGQEHDQTTLLVSLLQGLEDVLDQLARQPQQIGWRADALCVQHNQTLTLRLGSRSIRGRCAGIAPDGALLLETPGGRQSLYSGVLQP